MKPSYFLISMLLLTATFTSAQVKYQAGPELDNDKDNKLNRMIGGDDKSFYCYRIRSKGRGTSFYVEKYDKKTLTMGFSQEISLEDGDNDTKIEDVLFAQGNVYVFRRQYDKKDDRMTLFYQTISSSGKVSTTLSPITVVTSDHYEYIDFDIYASPDKTKFLVKSCHKADKNAEYTSDFILLDAANGMAKKWTKTVKQRLSNNNVLQNVMSVFGLGGFVGKDLSFVGLYIDDAENVFYCYLDETKNSSEKEKRYRLHMNTLNANEKAPKTVDITFEDDYLVKDIEFHKGDNNSMVVGGFVKDVIERRGRDLVKVGIFSCKVDLNTNSVVSTVTNFFGDEMLKALESNNKKSRYLNYKLDYILPVGDAVYYVGEQYRETRRTTGNSGGFGMSTSSSYWEYEYMDVIVAKLNTQGKFEWIKNVPLRNEVKMNFAHVFKQYIAVSTNKSIYILCNDHPKNIARYEKNDYEPSDLKTVSTIHGSNFVSNAVDLKSGSITRSLVFENDTYCFAPIQERNQQFIPPSECEIFQQGKDNEIYIYTEDRGRDQFGRIKFQ
ncbi:MAG: hypothetical protein WDN26_10500 [Chitinophagaceae bacterium]